LETVKVSSPSVKFFGVLVLDPIISHVFVEIFHTHALTKPLIVSSCKYLSSSYPTPLYVTVKGPSEGKSLEDGLNLNKCIGKVSIKDSIKRSSKCHSALWVSSTPIPK